MSEQNAEQVDSRELPPLVDWENPPTVADLKGDLEDAKPAHDAQVTKVSEWLDNFNVEGKAKPEKREGRSSVQPKLIRKQAEWRYPALTEPFLSTNDLYKISPVSWEDKEAARQNALVLNNQFNTKIPKVEFIDDFVRTVVNEGTAIVRIGWDFQEEEYEREVPDFSLVEDPSLAPLMQELSQMQQDNPTGYQHEVPFELQQAHAASMEYGVPMRPVLTGETQIITETRTVKNQPTLEVCDYRNIVVDPSCHGNLDDAGFIIHSFEASLSSLKKDGRYKNLEYINTNTNSILGEPDHATEDASNFNFRDEARKKFVVYEYWGYRDIDGSGVVKPIVASWVGDTLIRLEENPYPDKKLPFIKVQYLPKRKSTYGEPDAELLIDNQKIAGAVTRGMIDLMGRSANAQTGTRKGALDAVNKRKYQKGQDYEFNAGHTPDQAFYQHTYPEIPASAQFMLELQNYEAESLTGVKAFSGGLSGEALGDVATAVRGALDAASKRELSILRRLADGMVHIGRKIISMNQAFLEEEEVVRVTNDDFVAVRRDDLAGNFDMRVDISTAEEDNAKAQELAFMLQTLGPNEDPMIRKIILADIARLRKMPDLAKRFEEYEPQPDPLQQENLMLQNQLLKAQIANELSEARENDAGAQLDLAKARETIAKASNLQSDTDLKNLDFVEQESGVKQARELEQHGAQAQANMQLKLLEDYLERRRGPQDNKSAA